MSEASDQRLLHLLAEDASDLEAIGDALGVDQATVRKRTATLVERGLLSPPVARVDAAAAGLPVTAFFLLQVAQNAETYETIETMIRDVEQVEEAHAVSGRCDWIVKVRAESLVDVQQLLTRRLAILPGFVRAEALVVLNAACERINAPAVLFPRRA
ncbi:MAG TPA: Lrp/AsnC family transcriptional regulator [Solirubrobacterales bacterium]